MSNILQIALKDLKILSRDKAAMFFLIGLPVIMGLFFGFIYQGMGGSENINMAVAVVDEDNSKMSALFLDNLKSNESIEVVETDLKDATSRIRKGKLVGVIVVPKGFGDSAGVMWANEPAKIKIGKDPSRSAESAMLEGFVMEAVGGLIQERISDLDSMKSLVEKQKEDMMSDSQATMADKLVVGTMFDTMLDFFSKVNDVQDTVGGESDDAGGPTFQLAEVETFDAFKKSTNSTLSKIKTGWDISFPSAIMWGVMGCAAGFAISIVRERTRGTLLRLQTAPVSASQLILGKGLACFLAIFFVFALMISLGMAMGMRPESPLLLGVSCFFVAYCFVGIMMAMSVLGKSEEAVGGSGWAANVVMAMFGGAMIPLAFMPAFMKTISNFSPVKWSIFSFEGAIWRGFSFAEMLPAWGILLLIGSIGFAFGTMMLRRVSAI